jgi:polyribonucleotide nucleotidyltransferase
MAQKLDTLSPLTQRYMHHYNFRRSRWEASPDAGPSRRDIGHGALAERAIEPLLPDTDTFPYAIRTVSEIMSSNGSTSMASVCGSTLSLMDAGVPLKAPVAGIAMGLIMGDDGQYKVLTDIAGQEDFMGDMDFKVAGTATGITALQMDIKIGGVSRELLATALERATKARDSSSAAWPKSFRPRAEVSEFAPKMCRIQINPDLSAPSLAPARWCARSGGPAAPLSTSKRMAPSSSAASTKP